MRIGEDYDKLEWNISGFTFLEPNAFIGDTLLAVMAVTLAVLVNRIVKEPRVCHYWEWFFIILASSVLMGGLGHLMWNYWGLWGKYYSWISSIVSGYYMERAMIELMCPDLKKYRWVRFSLLKLGIAVTAFFVIIFTADLNLKPGMGLVIPMIYFAVTASISLGVMPVLYAHKTIYKSWLPALLVLLPAPVFQGLKINPATWFDRNDVSHLLLAISLLLMWRGIHSSVQGGKISVQPPGSQQIA